MKIKYQQRKIDAKKQVTPKAKLREATKVELTRQPTVDNEYDADSENDLKKIQLDYLQIKSESEESNEEEIEKRKNEFTNILNKSSVSPQANSDSTNSIEFHVHTGQTDDSALMILDCKKSMCDEFTLELSDSQLQMKPPSKQPQTISTRKRKAISEFINNPKNKENVTPPESQSTPALMKLACRKLDDSLFGFNDMETTLPFSPVPNDPSAINKKDSTSYLQTYSTSLGLNSIKLSPAKRKCTELDRSGFNDITQIEMPRKRSRRKKDKVQLTKESDVLENLRSQFEEVEMHELAFE